MMNTRLLVFIPIVLFCSAVAATEIICRPLTTETLKGSWEAITIPRPGSVTPPDQLWHLEVGNKDSDTYLVQMPPGSGGVNMIVVRELVSARISGDTIELHFAGLTSDPRRYAPPIWIVGNGGWSAEYAFIDASLFETDPHSFSSGDGAKIYFCKGTWTRELAEASKAAEKAIKEKRGRP